MGGGGEGQAVLLQPWLVSPQARLSAVAGLCPTAQARVQSWARRAPPPRAGEGRTTDGTLESLLGGLEALG